MISNEPSRMYAALRCIESELAKEKPSIAAIRAIILEAGRELRPTKYALDGGYAPASLHVLQTKSRKAKALRGYRPRK